MNQTAIGSYIVRKRREQNLTQERSRAECWCKGPLPLPQKAGSGYRLEF